MATFDHRVLRAWRLQSGMKPEQVCVQADMSLLDLRALEAGAHRNPSVGLLTRLAAAYGRDVRAVHRRPRPSGYPVTAPRLRPAASGQEHQDRRQAAAEARRAAIRERVRRGCRRLAAAE